MEKNHHRHGSIGNYIESFEILRSDGKRLTCDKNSNSEMFRASIGGMGLTGIILWAKMRLKKIQSAFLDVTTIKFQNLDEFISLASEKDAQFEYSVSWVDCGATGRDLGRGHMILGNHSGDDRLGFRIHSDPKYNIPFDFPNATLNALSVGLFNSAYYHRQRTKIKKTVQFYDPFFYPLDSVGLWNKIYGKRGFYQYQFVIPASEVSALRKCFELIATSKLASFLSVLKFFGSRKSEGLLSFPRPGLTLALDFPNQGEKTNNLFRQLDDLILKAGGRIYPAKDARMSSTLFQAMYPEWREFKKFMDPGFSSDFWKRISHES
jgi:FAD/FMN-containing dehydrogenase